MADRMLGTIKIVVEDGLVSEVTGIPDGYDYEIIDRDSLEEIEPNHDAIDDRLVVLTFIAGPGAAEISETTLAEFFAANGEIDDAGRYEIRKALAKGGHYEGGGGASPRFTITLADGGAP